MISIRKIAACTGHKAALYALSEGKDARHFRTAGGDGYITEWNLDAPETGRVVASVENQVFSLCQLPEKNRFVAGNMTGGLHWVDLSAPEKTRNVAHHNNKGVYALLMVENHLFSAGGDGVLTRWNAQTGLALESLHLSNRPLRSLAYCEQTGELAVGASDGSIYVLDAPSLQMRSKIPGAHLHSVFAVSWSLDGQSLVSGGRDAQLKIWKKGEIHAGMPHVSEYWVNINSQTAHLYTINHLVWSPDGRLLATASRDRTIKFWAADDFRLLKVVDTIRYGCHINSVNKLLWMPEALISCSDDRSALVWEVTSKSAA